MFRIWSARKKTTFVPEAVAAGSPAPHPLFRAGPEAAAATRQALRLLAGYTLLLLPLHLLVLSLSAYAPGLTAVFVLVTAAAFLAVAFARWLALDDLLRKLPLLLALGLVGAGLVFVASLPAKGWGSRGVEWWGSLFILIAVASVLASFYRPLAATYQAVTTRTPARDLTAAAGALLASLVLTLAAHAMPRFLLAHYAWGVSGLYAGLVLAEYAAWARANPAVGLERTIRFATAVPERKRPDHRGVVVGAAIFGGGFGLLSIVAGNVPSPQPDFVRSIAAWGGEPGRVVEVLALVFWVGLAGLVFGFLKTGHALGAMKPGDPVAAARFAWQAIVVFLTYPDVKHPLVHQLRFRWLRPPAVRVSVTCAALLTVATAVDAQPEKPTRASREERPVVPSVPAPPPAAPGPREILPGDCELARASGQPPEVWLGPEVRVPSATPPASRPAAAPAKKPDAAGAADLVDRVLGLVVVPPIVLALMVFLVGLHVLPTYGGYFEQPDEHGSPT